MFYYISEPKTYQKKKKKTAKNNLATSWILKSKTQYLNTVQQYLPVGLIKDLKMLFINTILFPSDWKKITSCSLCLLIVTNKNKG